MKMMALIRSLVLLASLGAFAADTACGQPAGEVLHAGPLPRQLLLRRRQRMTP